MKREQFHTYDNWEDYVAAERRVTKWAKAWNASRTSSVDGAMHVECVAPLMKIVVRRGWMVYDMSWNSRPGKFYPTLDEAMSVAKDNSVKGDKPAVFHETGQVMYRGPVYL